MLQAHGLDAGPTQRPLLAGAIAGLIAAVPALAVLVRFGSLDAPARATGTSSLVAGLAYGGLMLLGGVLYGWLFQRAANDPRGGWLFGMAFGFVLWMLGPVPLLQWLPDRADPARLSGRGAAARPAALGLGSGGRVPAHPPPAPRRPGEPTGSGSGRTGPEAVAQSRCFCRSRHPRHR